MLDTVKKRLLFLTTSLLMAFGLLIICFAVSFVHNNKAHRKANIETQVAYTAEKISNNYEAHHGIVNELSGIASVFYKSKSQDKSILISTIKNNYKNNLPESGVGIWYNPYSVNPAKKWFCIFAYVNNGKIVFNNSLENKEYNYPEKPWFTSIQNQVKRGLKNIYIPTTCVATGEKTYVLTIGSGIYSDNKMVGIITVDWKLDDIKDELATYHPTKNSYILLADVDSDFIISLTNADKSIIGSSLKSLSWYKSNLKTGDLVKDKNKFYVTFPKFLDNGLLLLVNVPIEELYGEIYVHLFIISILMILAVIFVALITYRVITNDVNKPIQYLVNVAEQIGSGDLNAKMEIEKPAEFAQLANAFNKMTKDIKEYITNLNLVTAEKNRMEAELSIAKSIQASSLPSVFPPYPDRKEFDIYANMIPAKEVGGDFYDFFFVDNDNFVFLIADVSGKGVPAALFMMEVKTRLQNIIKTGLELDEAVSKVNHKICKNNKQGYFVTAFIAKINLSTGQITFVNAGHNPPLLKRNDGDYSYLHTENNIIIGAIDNFVYQKEKTELFQGDELFFYTDGITEATSKELELFGEKRLIEVLNQNKEVELEQIIPIVEQNVYKFLDEEKQSDDITTLIFRYKGSGVEEFAFCERHVTTILLPADIERFSSLLDWVEGLCSKLRMKKEYRYRLNLAIEEIFVNIARYAYPPKNGDVEVLFKPLSANEVEVEFIDSGTPYNPLEQQTPDINASLENRQIGGLGIFMTKNAMDYMGYKFVNGKNILTMRLKYEIE